jgi:hypothetical protein
MPQQLAGVHRAAQAAIPARLAPNAGFGNQYLNQPFIGVS